MRMVDIIQKKRDGASLSKLELAFVIDGFVQGQIPDYQVSALLMAIFLRGMDISETVELTSLMLASGIQLDTSTLPGIKVDKHSTGGVGDKTSLIIAPIVAAAGAKVPMMSGRGLGHTGGTLDKLESIDGYRVFLSPSECLAVIDQVGYVMMGQTKDMVPADRLLYALRDVTATVESIPLITASILSKKKAEGTQALFLDIKTGSGAFMKNLADSRALAQSLVKVGTGLGMQVEAIISDMNSPLGYMIGNFFEVEECCRCLQNDSVLFQASIQDEQFTCSGPSGRLMALSLESAARMVVLAELCPSLPAARHQVLGILKSGKAWQMFRENIQLQGGDLQSLDKNLGTWRAPLCQDLYAEQSAYLQSIDALCFGKAAVLLGAGRNKTTDTVIPDVGIELFFAQGDVVNQGEAIARFYAHSSESLQKAVECAREGLRFSADRPHVPPLMYEEIKA